MNEISRGPVWRRCTLTAVLCALMFTGAGCGARRSEQARQEGDTLIKIGKTKEAEAAFKRALELNPGNARAKYGEGRLLELDKKSDEALSAYRESIKLDPALKEAYISAASLLVAAGKADEADALAEQRTKVDADDGALLAAQVYKDTNRLDKAIETLGALRDKNPTVAAVRTALGEACLAAKQYDKAEQELRTVVDGLDTESEAAWMALLDVFIDKGTLAQEVAKLKARSVTEAKNAAVQLAFARALMETDAVDDAEAVLKPVLERRPDSPWGNYVLGGCFLKRGKPTDAQVYLQKAAAALPRQSSVVRLLEIAKRGEGREPQKSRDPGAQAAPAAVETDLADEHWPALWRQARLERLLAREKEAVAEGGANLPETLVLACLFSLRTSALDELAKGLPASSPLRDYVQAFQAKKLQDMLAAVDKWNEPDDRDRQILRENAAGFVYALMNRRSQALLKYSETLKRFPENGVALYNLATMYGAAKMPEFQARALYKLIGQFPANVEARSSLVGVYRASGNADRAREVAQTTFALFPKDETVLVHLARLYIDAGDYDSAILAARRGVESHPDSVVAHLMQAETFLAAGKADECLDALGKASPTPATSRYASELAAFASAAKGEWPRVAEICGKDEASAYSLGMRYLCVAALLRTNRVSEAAGPLLTKEGAPIDGLGLGRAIVVALGKSPEDGPAATLGKALSANPEALSASAYGFASYESRLFSTAFAAFKEADAAAPQQPDLISMALASLSHLPSETKTLEMATDFTRAYPRLEAAWIGLAEVYHSAGNDDQAEKALTKAKEIAPDSITTWQQCARFASDRKDNTSALEAYRKLAVLTPDDPVVNNNLAYYVLETGGDAKEAVDRSTRALEKMKNNPNVLHTLGLAQLRSGDKEGAREHLAIALDLQPGDPTILLDYGQMLIASGDAEKGKEHARLAVQYADQLGVDFPRRAEAEKLIGAS
ncbi:MAG: tetratricopeptide repeat protein [Candidatus Hydrogenedentes bacterium]|nr:tetratricopeptide repeat protein [Candidatus Hydrogenedentota bacterium]